MASIFTKIINREIKSEILYEDDILIVIKDIKPEAKLHLLIIPKKEIETLNHLSEGDFSVLNHMFLVSKKMAYNYWVENWYKLMFNVWEKYQEVMHIHMHLLSDL